MPAVLAVLGVVGSVALAGTAVASAGHRSGKTVTITFTSWGGTSQDAQTKAWIGPFEKSHPDIKIVQNSPNDYAKIKAMVQSHHVTWDVVTVGNDFGLSKAESSLLTKIDCTVVDCRDLQPSRFLTTGYRVPETVLAVTLAYNTKIMAGHIPQGWRDFFDTKDFPGKRALWNWSGSGLIEAALLADGVKPANLYPLDVKRALAKIATIKSDIIWFDSPAQCTQLLADGEASMAMCPNGRVYTAKQNGIPVAIQWNQAIMACDYLVVPKGSAHVKEAMELIAYMTSPAHNAAYSYQLPYGPTNRLAASHVNPKIKHDLPTTHAKSAVYQNDAWYAKYGATLDQTFQNWLQSQ